MIIRGNGLFENHPWQRLPSIRGFIRSNFVVARGECIYRPKINKIYSIFLAGLFFGIFFRKKTQIRDTTLLIKKVYYK